MPMLACVLSTEARRILRTLRDILSDVVSDGRRAHDIIQNVRNTIKKGDSNRRRINLNELVTNVAHSIRRMPWPIPAK